MNPDLKLPFIFLLVGVSFPVEHCPPQCRCDWKIHSVLCTGIEVAPFFHYSIQEVWLVRTKLASVPQNMFGSLPNISHM
ncbi:hypothetical protein ILYODFUR_036086 [Ilyodon furcidens]|uniref:Uncharacterized protein n=2 Tax=Goodeidae TaxID=28758 RepID=A0ABV0UNR6_9TELE